MATDVTFVTNVDLSNNELRNAKAQVLATDPTGVEGKFIYNSTDKQLKFYNGTAWVPGGAQVANLSGQASAFGQSAANGSAATAARSDHYHALPAHDASAHSAIKLSDLAAPSANLALAGYKLTGLGAGSANGDSVRYEQVVGVYAPLASPALTGTPTAPTAAAATNTTQIATTAYVKSQGYATTASPTFTGTVVLPSTTSIGNVDSTEIGYLDGVTSAIQTQLGTKAPTASPTFTGVPAAPTAAVDTNTTQIATTAYVVGQGYLKSSGYTAADVLTKIKTVDGTGSGLDADLLDGNEASAFALSGHTHTIANVTNLQTTLDAKAPLASPALTGTPTAPTAAAGTNTTQVATTAFVQAAVSASAAGLDVKQSARLYAPGIGIGTYNSTGGAKGRGQFTAAVNIVDGVTLAAGDRILVGSSNFSGIWVVTTVGTGSNGVWDRATDFDDDAEVTANAFVFVEEGAHYADTGWVHITNHPLMIGGVSGTALEWTQF